MGNGMMRAFGPAACLLCLLAVAGCATLTRDRDAGPVAAPVERQTSLAEEMITGDRGRAWSLYGRGQYPEAVIEFRKVMAYGRTVEEREDGRFGLAKCLIRMEMFAQAVDTLGPFSTSPQTDATRRRMALAGQAMLLDGRTGDAETLLEIALTDRDAPDVPPWMGACSANLARAYLYNDKPAKAVTMYEKAADIFRQAGRADAATRAEEMAESLRAAL